MLKSFSSASGSVREKKIAETARQLGYFFKNLTKKFCSFETIEAERRFAAKNKNELAGELESKKLRLNAKPGCGYLTF